MSVSGTYVQSNPSIQAGAFGSYSVKDVWTVSGGNYTPKFKIQGFILVKGSDATAAIACKFTEDETSDVLTLPTGVIIRGQVISALQTGTTATTVIFLG